MTNVSADKAHECSVHMHRHMAPTYGAYKLPVFTTHTYKK